MGNKVIKQKVRKGQIHDLKSCGLARPSLLSCFRIILSESGGLQANCPQ